MKSWFAIIVVFAVGMPLAYAHGRDTIRFSGRVIAATSVQGLTQIVPITSADSKGNTSTTYAVKSIPTSVTLATFATRQSAEVFQTEVTPTMVYRSP